MGVNKVWFEQCLLLWGTPLREASIEPQMKKTAAHFSMHVGNILLFFQEVRS